MNVGFIGHEHGATERLRAVDQSSVASSSGVWWLDDGDAFDGYPSIPEAARNLITASDVIVFSGALPVRAEFSAYAVRSGVHVLTDWPPAPSVDQCRSLATLVEEAGTKFGVSRPLRFVPQLRDVHGEGPTSSVVIELESNVAMPVTVVLADILDLAFWLTGSRSVLRHDIDVTRRSPVEVTSVVISARLQNGAFVVGLWRYASSGARSRVYTTGSDGRSAIMRGTTLDYPFRSGDGEPQSPVYVETEAYLEAVADGSSLPVSLVDGLQTMRAVEQLMRQLR